MNNKDKVYKPYNSELPNLRKHELITMVISLRERVDLLSEESWPFEWVVASEERSRRQSAEDENKHLHAYIDSLERKILCFESEIERLKRLIPGGRVVYNL